MPAGIFYRQTHTFNGLWQKVERLLLQLLFSYFGPSFNRRLEKNFLEDRKFVGCCCMDQWPPARLRLLTGRRSPACSPSSSSKRENLSVHFHISAPEIEHVRACAWFNGIAPPLHAGVQLWDYFNS